MSVFIESLLAAPVPVIAEVKRTKADGSELVGSRTTAEIVRAYQEAGAACLSVVTGRWFGGDLALLGEVTGACGLPVLQKDFIVREQQLTTAVDLRASAVLLTATILPVGALATLVGRALALGLTPFVEVVHPSEIESVPNAEDCVIAVNNKDIKDQERGAADLTRSTALLPSVLATGCRCPVSASGIEQPEQAAHLLDEGFRGVLVGTGLLRAASPATWLADVAQARKER